MPIALVAAPIILQRRIVHVLPDRGDSKEHCSMPYPNRTQLLSASSLALFGACTGTSLPPSGGNDAIESDSKSSRDSAHEPSANGLCNSKVRVICDRAGAVAIPWGPPVTITAGT